jgi:hypothetical protein
MFSASTLNLSKPIPTQRDQEEPSSFLSTSESGRLHTYIAPAEANSSPPPFQNPNSSPPVRRRSLFSASTSRRHTVISSGGNDFVPPKLQRSFTFFQRLSPLNSTVSAESA